MRSLLAALIGLSLFGLSPALARDLPASAVVERSDETSKVRFIGTERGSAIAPTPGVPSGASPAVVGKAFLQERQEDFGLVGSTLAWVDTGHAPRGGSVVRYQQRIGGVDVIGGEFLVHLDGDGRISFVAGEAEPHADLDVTPSVSSADAEITAITRTARDAGVPQVTLSSTRGILRIYDSRLTGGLPTAGAVLVWSFDVSDPGAVRRRVLVDARDGTVVTSLERAPQAKNRTICDAGNFDAELPCTHAVLSEGGSYSGSVPDVRPAYDFSGATYDYYMTRFDRDSVDDRGLTLRSTVRYCAPQDACPYENAFWDPDKLQMVYGDHYASADDVVGHELTHGITDATSGLIYQDQSGAINESMSDIFGEFIDQVTSSSNDASGDRWEIGESLPIGAIRDMADPGRFDQPDSMSSSRYYTGSDDQGGVHTNSGVGNKAAYLIAAGGSLHNVTITGIGNDKTARVFYLVETGYLTPGSDYAALGSALRGACDELVGTHGITRGDCVQVRKSVLATQMVAPAPPTARIAVPENGVRAGTPFTVDGSGSDDPDGAILGYSWETSDGATGGSETFTHTFASPGPASISLTVIDGQGDIDTATRTFNVRRASSAFIELAGCTTHVLARNDDLSTGLVDLPFQLSFFGQQRSALYVNNNGNVTFDSSLSTYTPFDLSTTDRPIIAPFFADVDTRNLASDEVRYGAATYGGRPAFCVNWDGVSGVGYYANQADKLNRVQLLLVDRSDEGVGDFDIYFNYDQVRWETGSASGGSGGLGGASARAGYANGTLDPGALFEIPGSAVNGAFLDSAATGLANNSRGSTLPGRYVFPVRNGQPPGSGRIHGRVLGGTDPVPGAPLQVCLHGTGTCVVTRSSSSGMYSAFGLAEGQYDVTASPPVGDNAHAAATVGGVQVVTGADVQQDVTLTTLASAPPSDTTVTNIGSLPNGTPVIDWNADLTLRTQGCAGGAAHYTITRDGAVIRDGTLSPVAGQPGTFQGVIPALRPITGYVAVQITITGCSDPANNESVAFGLYVDPSGTVRTVDGDPIPQASVTLSRSDNSAGPFDVVPDGSDVMAPSNRHNPDPTGADGRFGWDVIAGYYRVRAEHAGCHDPSAEAQAFVDSPVLTIPPPVTDLDLRMACDVAVQTPTSASFGDQQVGGSGSARSIEVTNSGLGRLHVTAAALSGPNAADFQITANSCQPAGGVPPAATCAVSVSFNPLDIGARTASLVLTDDVAAGPQQTVGLSGSGTPRAVVGPSIALRTPADGTTYALRSVVLASYSCSVAPGAARLASCVGTRPNNSVIDTLTLGARAFTVVAKDTAGKTTTVTARYTVIPDRTPPVIAVVAPVEGATYTQRAAVSASYACSDEVGGSGLLSCQGTKPNGVLLDTSRLGAQGFTVIARDVAGNMTTRTVHYVVVADTLRPTITLTRPVDGASYPLGTAVTASYSCADEPGGSGVASCVGTKANGARIDTSRLGTQAFTVVAKDRGGNTMTRTNRYTVVTSGVATRSSARAASGAAGSWGVWSTWRGAHVGRRHR